MKVNGLQETHPNQTIGTLIFNTSTNHPYIIMLIVVVNNSGEVTQLTDVVFLNQKNGGGCYKLARQIRTRGIPQTTARR